MLDLTGKTYLVFGVANRMSICWHTAKFLDSLGATLIISCIPPLVERVEKLVDELSTRALIVECDVSDDESLDECFKVIAQHAPIDGCLHGVAFSDKRQLQGNFLDTTRENFRMTLEISCFSFIDCCRRLGPLLTLDASIVNLTFEASRGVFPNYNVMAVAKAGLEIATLYAASEMATQGVRVNSVSASPLDTLSARGIRHFRRIGDFSEAQSPLERRATFEEVANEIAYLLSTASSGVTGQIRNVNCGANITTMPPIRNADRMAKAMTAIVDTVAREAGKEEG